MGEVNFIETEEIYKVIDRLDRQVLATPTGELRELLTDARTLLTHFTSVIGGVE